MAIDTKNSYTDAKNEIKSVQTHKALKDQYKNATRSAGDSFEEASAKVSQSINDFSEKAKNVKQAVKNQFEELLDISSILGGGPGGGGNSSKYIKALLINALRKIKPIILELLIEETIKAVGCDQNQQIGPSQVVYINVNSVDIGGLLKIDPNSKAGSVLYEPKLVEIQSNPFSMNRELYHLIQTGQAYSALYNTQYIGNSGQPLFDIQYVTVKTEPDEDNIPRTEYGDFFKITIANRILGGNGLKQFIRDYFSTISPFEFQSVISRIFDAILNCVKIEANFGLEQTKDASTFDLLIQRIFGLCLDKDTEINVSGISKAGELDGPINDAFFNLSPIDLRNIDQTVSNVQNKVIQFVDCGNVNIPVNSAQIIEDLTKLNFVEGDELIKKAEDLSNVISNDLSSKGLTIGGDISASIDTDFIKKMIQGLISAIFSPKVILGLLLPLKIISQSFFDAVRTYTEFMKKFSTYAGEIISKVGALLVKEIVDTIKKDLFNLLQSLVLDLAKEKADKRIIMILKLIQLLDTVAKFINDYRQCKSVIEDILRFIKLFLTGTPFDIPLPLLYACALLPGFSSTRAGLNIFKELQKYGYNTGTLPSGAPNYDVLAKQSSVKAHADEFAENNRVSIGLPPIPVGLVVSSPMPVPFGKCF